jgi:hypothetical protein
MFAHCIVSIKFSKKLLRSIPDHGTAGPMVRGTDANLHHCRHSRGCKRRGCQDEFVGHNGHGTCGGGGIRGSTLSIPIGRPVAPHDLNVLRVPNRGAGSKFGPMLNSFCPTWNFPAWSLGNVRTDPLTLELILTLVTLRATPHFLTHLLNFGG